MSAFQLEVSGMVSKVFFGDGGARVTLNRKVEGMFEKSGSRDGGGVRRGRASRDGGDEVKGSDEALGLAHEGGEAHADVALMRQRLGLGYGGQAQA